jgi:hypothetical protein
MSLLTRVLFKLMELSLGLRPYFSLRTRNPIFVNFDLSETERAAVQAALPSGFTLRALRFAASDGEPRYWLSYNLYEIRYPKKEMAKLRKVRCEINTFVSDASGREGVFVFCGSPFVSREEEPSAIGRVADLAERLVIWIYGCGRLTRLRFDLAPERLLVDLDEPENRMSLDIEVASVAGTDLLSPDYQRFNDVSFFNDGKTYDLVNVDSAFGRARLQRVDGALLAEHSVKSPFFERAPDVVYAHRGEIGYLVSALNRVKEA